MERWKAVPGCMANNKLPSASPYSLSQENRLTLNPQKCEKCHRQNTQRRWWAPLINNSWSPGQQQNIRDSGGPGTFFLQKHQWMKLWRKPDVPFSSLEEWVLSKETWTPCHIWNVCGSNSFVWLWKLDLDRRLCYWLWRVFKKLEGGSLNSLDFIRH